MNNYTMRETDGVTVREVSNYTVPEDCVLVLRSNTANDTSYNDFQWPHIGHVSAPDWNPKPVCGYGLHGALWGVGDGNLFRFEESAIWKVVEVESAAIVNLGGKVKFPECTIVHSGTQKTATDFLKKFAPPEAQIIGATATAGYQGTAIAGDYGTAIAGDYGTATAGYRGTATAGYRGTAAAGQGGIIQLWFFDEVSNRRRAVTGYVGENGVKPNTGYRLFDGVLQARE